MSMLSSQVDELRELATRYDELQVGAVKAVTMPSNMGSILREAADTIWELRDDLQRANAENAKLRELCETVIDDWMSKVCPTFPFCECGGEYESCADDTCGNQLYRQMLRELGEGVDW